MMQDFQNALYINPDDPTNAAIYDKEWLLRELSNRGLVIRAVQPPDLRGFHWHLYIGHVWTESSYPTRRRLAAGRHQSLPNLRRDLVREVPLH